MEIQRIFSDQYDEERLYSVLLSEDEMYLFSEIQREFARKDYEGLTRNQKIDLHARRSDYAKDLWEARKLRNKSLGEVRDIFNVSDGVKLINTVEGGGIKSHNQTIINRRTGETPMQSAKRAMDAQKTQMLRGSKDASDIMRKEVLEGVGPKASKEAREKANKFLDQMDNVNKKPKIKVSGKEDPLTRPLAKRSNKNKEVSEVVLGKSRPAKKGILEAATGFAKRNKKALAITGASAGLAAGGAYLYNTKKKKNQK